MVLLASSFDQESKYLRAQDLKQEKILRIKAVTPELLGQGAEQESKPVVWFTNHKKGLVLNMTNRHTIAGSYGDDMEGWAGKLIVAYPTTTPFNGKNVPCLRVRIPPPKGENVPQPQPVPSTPPPTPEQQLNTFAQAKPKVTPTAPPPEPDLEVDLDDEIPF